MTLTMPEAAQAWLRHQATVRAAQDELATITGRKREILLLTAKGLAQDEISAHLRISPRVVSNEVAEIKGRTGLTMIEAVVLAARAGWV